MIVGFKVHVPVCRCFLIIVSCVNIAVFAGTPLTEEDSDALEKLLLDKKIKEFTLTGERTYEAVERHLRELEHRELAANLRGNLDKGW